MEGEEYPFICKLVIKKCYKSKNLCKSKRLLEKMIFWLIESLQLFDGIDRTFETRDFYCALKSKIIIKKYFSVLFERSNCQNLLVWDMLVVSEFVILKS